MNNPDVIKSPETPAVSAPSSGSPVPSKTPEYRLGHYAGLRGSARKIAELNQKAIKLEQELAKRPTDDADIANRLIKKASLWLAAAAALLESSDEPQAQENDQAEL